MGIFDFQKNNQNESRDNISSLLEDLASLEGYVYDLFNFSPLPTCYVNPLGIILETNPAFEKLTRYTASELIGNTVDTVLEQHKIDTLRKNVLKKEHTEETELMVLSKDKRKIPVQAFARARINEQGEAIGFFVGAFNLINIKKTEQNLKDSQTALLNILEDSEKARKRAEKEKEKTETIIANFTDGLLLFDCNKHLTLINPQAEKYLKVKKRTVIGKTISELSKNTKFKLIAKVLKDTPRKVPRKNTDPDEEQVLEVTTVKLHKSGPHTEHLVILHDVTREKIIEKLKTEFVSISAHQLRTPLSAVKWTLEMLLDGDLGDITEEQREFLERTRKSNERMINLVNSLLDVTRIEEGKFIYEKVSASLTEITESVLEVFQEKIKRKRIKLKFAKPSKPLRNIPVDTEKVHLSIQNLIDNAIKYTLPEHNITIKLSQTRGGVKFEITDTGVGIPKKQQKRIFTKFFRGTNVIKLETVGSGLGLFISKNIIEAHGGKFGFKSTEGKGTTFWFTLPGKDKKP